MENWTKDLIPNLSGKVFIVTGANSGLGYESAMALAEKNATVIMACRNPQKAMTAIDNIRESVPDAKLEFIELDLASLSSVQAFSSAYKKKYDRLDCLINNGGPVGAPKSVTKDGFELHFGVVHLGHFALTGQLIDLLVKTPDSRIVTVSSRMHSSGKINWDDLMSEQSYDRWEAYKQSKLANLLFTFELNRKLSENGSATMAVAAHPGQAKTNWAENNISGPMKFIAKFVGQKASMGALSQLYASTDPNVNPGGYYGPHQDKKGYPAEIQAADSAYDEIIAKKLWEVSENLTEVKYNFSQYF